MKLKKLNNLIPLYLDIVHKLEERKSTLSPACCKSYYDYFQRVQCLDEEIEDMYYAINLMRGRIAD